MTHFLVRNIFNEKNIDVRNDCKKAILSTKEVQDLVKEIGYSSEFIDNIWKNGDYKSTKIYKSEYLDNNLIQEK